MSNEFWDKNAATWTTAIREQLIASRKITNRAIADVINASGVKSVVDLGCGEGWLASGLRPEVRYHGLDSSGELVRLAQQKYGERFSMVSYQQIAEGSWQPTEKFEGAVFNFSLMEENLAPLLKGLGRKLAPGARLWVQTLHPCYVLSPYRDGWQSEDFRGFPLPFDGSMPWYGRMLSSWLRELRECGLELRNVVEPGDGERACSVLFELRFSGL